nr:MAG TPA: short tail fiber protein [Caudoviricetes sp.]
MNYSVNLSSGQTIEVVIGEAAQINVEQALNYIESGRVEITKYVNEWAKPEITNYTNEYAKPIVTEIVNQTTKPLIDNYLNTTTKPQIDEYVADNVKPYADSAQESAANAKISENNAKTSETNAKASETAAASSAGVASAAAVTATEAKDYTAKVLTDENLKTVGQDLQSADSNIKTVATNIVNVNTVAKNIDNVNLLAPHTEAMEALAPDIMDVVTVAGIAKQTKNVSDNMAHVVAVDNNKANIDKAVANATNITTVATSINNVNAVAGNKANIDNVAANKTNINNVSANITAVNNVSENMADVKAAVQSANDAKLWAIGTITEKPEGSSKYWAEQAQQAAQVYDASETVKGIVRLATSEEAEAGLDDKTAITPLKLKQNIVDNVGRVNQLGFNGTLESGVITFTPDQGTYELKAGYEYEIDLLFSAVGIIPDNTQLKIVNGTDTINIVNVLDSDYSKPTTYKAMKQVCRYDTEIGWRWIFNVRYSVASDGSKVFVMPSTATNVDTTDIYNKIDTKQDISTAVNYNNITNCITEIPQDIKLELNNGTLTLKAGSKVYIPNGKDQFSNNKFDVVTIDSDLSIPKWNNTVPGLISITSNREIWVALMEQQYSGISAPTSQYALWYDTLNNKIKSTSNAGSTWKEGYCLPIAICAADSSNWTSINQIFNGLGYIGSTAFALPGVKGLIPDDILKSIEFAVNNVLIITQTSDRNAYITLNSNTIAVPTYSEFGFDEENNYNTFNNTKIDLCNAGNITYSNGRIVSFTPKTVFHALDYNDKSTISGWSMPSSRYIDLTLGASGSVYTAPANGWVYISKTSGNVNQSISAVNTTRGYSTEFRPYAKGSDIRLLFPVSKGDIFQIHYTANDSTSYFRFIFAEGEAYNKVKNNSNSGSNLHVDPDKL